MLRKLLARRLTFRMTLVGARARRWCTGARGDDLKWRSCGRSPSSARASSASSTSTGDAGAPTPRAAVRADVLGPRASGRRAAGLQPLPRQVATWTFSFLRVTGAAGWSGLRLPGLVDGLRWRVGHMEPVDASAAHGADAHGCPLPAQAHVAGDQTHIFRDPVRSMKSRANRDRGRVLPGVTLMTSCSTRRRPR